MASIVDRPDTTVLRSSAGVAAYAPWIAAALAVVGIVAMHAETAQSIVAIWQRSATFAHGFLVVPIALWLAWRNRHEIAAVPARPFQPALVVIAIAGAMWLVTTAADVVVLRQFALVFMLQAALIAVLGWSVARAMAFPLFFLLFAVPFGEFLVPKMIELTADFTVAAVRVSGVPVYREANHFVIPSGQWSVVEACAGLRYLIASVMVGVLFAALRYRSAKRRIAFVVAAIAVPIVANWLRAYMIVMIGHLSNNRLAVGVDHLLYGWVFFGIVMALLFWVGAFWAEDTLPETAAHPVIATPRATARWFYVAAVLAVVIAGVWRPLYASIERSVSSEQTLTLAPLEDTNGWIASPLPANAWAPSYFEASAQIAQAFTLDGQRAEVRVLLYRNQRKGHELVTSENQVVRAEDNRWREVGNATSEVVLSGARHDALRTTLASGQNRFVVYRLYWINGRVTASDYEAKAWLALARLTGRSDDSAVMFVLARDDEQRDVAKQALQDLWPAILRTLERAQASR